MTVEAKTYCGFWMKSLWVLKGVCAIVFIIMMAVVAAGCELTCNKDSPGAQVSGEDYKCNGALRVTAERSRTVSKSPYRDHSVYTPCAHLNNSKSETG